MDEFHLEKKWIKIIAFYLFRFSNENIPKFPTINRSILRLTDFAGLISLNRTFLPLLSSIWIQMIQWRIECVKRCVNVCLRNQGWFFLIGNHFDCDGKFVVKLCTKPIYEREKKNNGEKIKSDPN